MDASCECQSSSGSQYITRCVEPTWQALRWNHTKKSSYFQALFNRHLSRCRCKSDESVMMLDSFIIINCKINDWISDVLTDFITGRWKLRTTPLQTSIWLLHESVAQLLFCSLTTHCSLPANECSLFMSISTVCKGPQVIFTLQYIWPCVTLWAKQWQRELQK